MGGSGGTNGSSERRIGGKPGRAATVSAHALRTGAWPWASCSAVGLRPTSRLHGRELPKTWNPKRCVRDQGSILPLRHEAGCRGPEQRAAGRLEWHVGPPSNGRRRHAGTGPHRSFHSQERRTDVVVAPFLPIRRNLHTRGLAGAPRRPVGSARRAEVTTSSAPARDILSAPRIRRGPGAAGEDQAPEQSARRASKRKGFERLRRFAGSGDRRAGSAAPNPEAMTTERENSRQRNSPGKGPRDRPRSAEQPPRRGSP